MKQVKTFWKNNNVPFFKGTSAPGRGGVFLTLTLLFLFNSCLTVQRIEKNCDKFAKVCITETVKETVYRDTTIYRTDTLVINLPRDTVTITDTITIINNRAYLSPVFKQFGLIGVNARVNNSVLNVNAWLTDSTILHHRTDTILIEKAIKAETVTNTVPVVKKYIPAFYKFTFWAFIIIVVIVVGWVLWKIKLSGPLETAKRYLK